MKVERELIFVYNADSGRLNGALDLLHKTFSPKTYECNLCKVTYGTFGMDRKWRKFIESSKIPFKFLHKDEWLLETDRQDDLPAVFERTNDELKLVISAKKLEKLSLDELKREVEIILN